MLQIYRARLFCANILGAGALTEGRHQLKAGEHRLKAGKKKRPAKRVFFFWFPLRKW